MRTLQKTLLAGLAIAASWPTSAGAEPPPPPSATTLRAPLSSFEPIVPRADVASLSPLGPLPLRPRFGLYGYGSSPPLRTAGIVVASLGAATMFGAGVTAIVAAASSSDLAKECPGGLCVEGTSGGRSYTRAVDSARAADWLIGIGMPVLGSGLVMIIFSAVLERNSARAWPTTVLRASPTGATLAVQF